MIWQKKEEKIRLKWISSILESIMVSLKNSKAVTALFYKKKFIFKIFF
jgi:hypothetical protein